MSLIPELELKKEIMDEMLYTASGKLEFAYEKPD
jgi:hypothetical protein